jgi:hypothetical protein
MYANEAELGPRNFRRIVRQHHEPKESTMDKIEDDSTIQSAVQSTAPRNVRKPQSLRFERQLIRSLTGAQLKLVGGGCGYGSPGTSSCGGSIHWTK